MEGCSKLPGQQKRSSARQIWVAFSAARSVGYLRTEVVHGCDTYYNCWMFKKFFLIFGRLCDTMSVRMLFGMQNQHNVQTFYSTFLVEPPALPSVSNHPWRALTLSLVNKSDLPCDLPCAASLAGIQPVRPRAQRTSPWKSPSGCL